MAFAGVYVGSLVAVADDPPLRNPIIGIACCCARAASGHAAAPPSVAKNLRRAMWLANVTLRLGVIHAMEG